MVLKGQADNLYITFFGVESKAAMLACDLCGYLPDDLLFLPKKEFKQSPNDTDEQVLIRYTMHERQRQTKLHKLMGEKNRLLQEGNIPPLWEERKRITPDAPKAPKITKKQLQKAQKALDTSSDDDERIDERGMVKPVPVTASEFKERMSLDNHSEWVPVQSDPSRRETGSSGIVVSTYPSSAAAPPPTNCTVEDFGNPSLPSTRLFPLSNTHPGCSELASSEPSPLYVGGGAINTNIFLDAESLPRISQVLKRSNLQPPKAPPMPSLTHYPRTPETLVVEEKELECTKQEMAKYSKKAPKQIKEYTKLKKAKEAEEKEWKRQLARMEASERRRNRPEALDALLGNTNDIFSPAAKDVHESRGPSSFCTVGEMHHTNNSNNSINYYCSYGNEDRMDRTSTGGFGGMEGETGTSNGGASSPQHNASRKPEGVASTGERSAGKMPKGGAADAKSATATLLQDPHHRQIEATRRVALRRAEVVSNCFQKGLEVDRGEVPPQGTISHWIKYEEMIGKAPPLEVRLKETQEHRQAVQQSFESQRHVEWEGEKTLHRRLERAATTAETAREKKRRIRQEVRTTTNRLTEDKLKCVARSRDIEKRHQMAKAEEKHRKAEEFNSQKYGDMAARHKYEHDREELFRRKMKDSLMTMQHRKRWEMDTIKSMTA